MFDETSGSELGSTAHGFAPLMDARCRIFGTPKADGLPETRAGAEEAERRAITRVLETGDPKPVVETKEEVPTIEEFHKVFLATSAIINKPSSVASKEKLLRFHIVPRLGHLTTFSRAAAPDATSASSNSVSSSPGATTSLSARITSRPRAAACSATTSIAAAFSSTT